MNWYGQEKGVLWRRESYAIGGNCLIIWDEGDQIMIGCVEMEIAG